jgi:uncharacterized membrane protein YfbV (UPF0208 family)
MTKAGLLVLAAEPHGRTPMLPQILVWLFEVLVRVGRVREPMAPLAIRF